MFYFKFLLFYYMFLFINKPNYYFFYNFLISLFFFCNIKEWGLILIILK